jgi:hypothetical protein
LFAGVGENVGWKDVLFLSIVCVGEVVEIDEVGEIVESNVGEDDDILSTISIMRKFLKFKMF